MSLDRARMIRVLFMVVTAATGRSIYGDDSAVEVASGTPSAASMSHDFDIQMVSEDISVKLLDNTYQVNARFEFYNFGPAKTVEVGFPQWQRGTMDRLDIKDFSARVNGQPIPVSTVESDTELGEVGVRINKWFVRSITFPPASKTISEITYSVPYGIGTGAEYLYGTGATWKGSIQRIHVEIVNAAEKWINWIEFGDSQTPKLENKSGVVTFDLLNLEPKADALVMIGSDSVPLGLTGPKIPNPERDWYYARKLLSQTDLLLMTVGQLRVVRNLILAAHGQVFQSDDLRAWFQKYCSEWYKPTGQVDLETLSQMERKNLESIQTEETKRKGTRT